MAMLEQEYATPATAQTVDEQQTAATKKRAGATEGGAMKLRRLAQDEEHVPEEEQTAISTLAVQAVGTRPKSKARAPQT